MRPGNQVVHISGEAHAIAKAHCKANKLAMSDWISGLIRKATSELGRRAIVHDASCRCARCSIDRRHGVKP